MLYFIKSTKYVKIGYAKDISKRMKYYFTNNPDYELLDLIEGELIQEKFLHKILKDFRYRTEWYYNVQEVYDVWNSYKQGFINKKTVPTKLCSTDVKFLNIVGEYLKFDSSISKYTINLNLKTIQTLRRRLKCKKSEIIDLISTYIDLKWIIPYKEDNKIFNIDSINNYLKDDSYTFDKNELQLMAYVIPYMDS